jgi:hypothetical protein
VSSSGIRQAIDIGDVSVVRSLLGGDYELDVEHVTPQRTGDGLVFPASSLTQLLPRPGRYSGFVRSVSGGPVSGGPVSGGPVSGGPVSGGPVSGGPASGGSTARIAVESDRVIVNAAADPVAGIRFARRES